MGMQAKDCVTLHQYIRQVLGIKQAEVARRACCDQSWVSIVFGGELPGRNSRTWVGFIQALSLIGQEEQFVRMVQNAARLRALKKHISQDFPLALFAADEANGKIVRIPPGLDYLAHGPKAVNE